jgi:hypothetical protein
VSDELIEYKPVSRAAEIGWQPVKLTVTVALRSCVVV